MKLVERTEFPRTCIVCVHHGDYSHYEISRSSYYYYYYYYFYYYYYYYSYRYQDST